MPSRTAPRLIFAILVTLCFAALTTVQALYFLESSRRQIGVYLKGDTLEVDETRPGLPAAGAGIRGGDLIVELAGSPVTTPGEYDRVAGTFDPDSRQQVVVERGGRLIRVSLQPGVPFPWGDFLPFLFAALGYLALGLMVLLQPVRSLQTRLLSLLCCAIALEFTAPVMLPGTWGSLTNAGTYLLVGLQVGLVLHLASLTPARPSWLQRSPGWIAAWYAVGVTVGVGGAATEISEGVLGWWWPWTTDQVAWFQDLVLLPVWSLAAVALLVRPALRFPGTRGRHQARLVLLGLSPWMLYVWVGGALEVFASPDQLRWLYALEPFVLLGFPAAVFVAIAQYQLFRIEMVLRRGLVYGLMTVVLAVVFCGVLGLGSLLLARQPVLENVWLMSAAALVIGLLFFPLRQVMKTFVEQRFFPERLELRRSLVELAAELPEHAKVPRMGEHLVSRVVEIFRLRSATVLVADPGSGLLISSASSVVDFERDVDQTVLLPPDDVGLRMLQQLARPVRAKRLRGNSDILDQCLDRFQASWVVPLINRDRLVGILLMGHKQSRRHLESEELELVALLAHHLASTLENVRLMESATIEGLTGLLRRESILERLDAELQRALRYRRPLAVAMIDLDHFKNVNDRYGHLAGDAMLKRVAGALSRGLRTADSLGRYGGEEFLLVMPETDLEGASRVAEKLRGRVEDLRVPMADGSEPRVTLSIGLSYLGEADLPPRPTARELIEAADRSLYRAKKSGRNRVEPTLAAVG